MKVLVCGGRDYQDFHSVNTQLTSIDGITEIIHGGSSGADHMADEWARQANIPCKVYPPFWEKYGKAAGPIRNQFMIDFAKPDLVIAFPGGRGTADMVRRAKAANIRVICYGQKNNHRS